MKKYKASDLEQSLEDTYNEAVRIPEDYTYHPRKLENTCCKHCGISSFSHFHKAGTKPNEFERIDDLLNNDKEI